tara:strand:- start:746 stop:1024 length:279 start_codon:yes stop_codon:yes gene_type:complete
MKIITIEKSAIDRFCKSWPCHGFPSNLDLIVFATNDGDLIDLELCDAQENVITSTDYEGSGAMPALLAAAEENAIRKPLLNGCIAKDLFVYI